MFSGKNTAAGRARGGGVALMKGSAKAEGVEWMLQVQVRL